MIEQIILSLAGIIIQGKVNQFDLFPPLVTIDLELSGYGCERITLAMRRMWKGVRLDVSTPSHANRSIRTIRQRAQAMMKSARADVECAEFWVNEAIMAMYTAGEHFAPKTAKKRKNRARCTWEIFTYYEEALHTFNFSHSDRYADGMVSFLQYAWNQDREYVCGRYSDAVAVFDGSRLNAIKRGFEDQGMADLYQDITNCRPSIREDISPQNRSIKQPHRGIDPGIVTPIPPTKNRKTDYQNQDAPDVAEESLMPRSRLLQKEKKRNKSDRQAGRASSQKRSKRSRTSFSSRDQYDEDTPPPSIASERSSNVIFSDPDEVTPPPPKPIQNRDNIYDPDYDLSPDYHIQFAEQFERVEKWTYALEAWDNAIRLMPRRRYRLRRLNVMLYMMPINEMLCDFARQEIKNLQETYQYLKSTQEELAKLERLFAQGGCL